MHRLWGIWSKVSQNLKYPTRSGACQCSGTTKTLDGKTTLQIYTVKLQWKRDTCKKCTLYKYLPYTVQCRSYSKKTVNQLYIYSTVLGAAIKCQQYSEITVKSGTHVKSVKITLNIFAVCQVAQFWAITTGRGICQTFRTIRIVPFGQVSHT